MKPLHKILVPTDFSSASLAAARCAAQLAERSGGELRLLHVLQKSREPHRLVELTDRLRRRHPALDVRSASIPSNLIAATILGHAEEIGSDLIVLGTSSRGEMSRFILGSTATSVVRGSKVPVITLRADAKLPLRDLRLVVAVDLADGAKDVLREAIGIARTLRADLEVVHAIEPSVDAKVLRPAPEKSHASSKLERARALQKIERLIDSAMLGFGEADRPKTRVRCVFGFAPEALSEFLMSSTPDLLLLGSHECTSTRRPCIGSVAERLVVRAICPVAVLRPRESPVQPREVATAP